MEGRGDFFNSLHELTEKNNLLLLNVSVVSSSLQWGSSCLCHARSFSKAGIPQLDFKWKGKKCRKTTNVYTGVETTNTFEERVPLSRNPHKC